VISQGDLLACTIARWAATLPRMTTFAASAAALAGLRAAQELRGARVRLWGHGGAYDPRGEVALFERAGLFNCAPRARLDLPAVLGCVSRGTRLLATPAQVDGAAQANLSVIGGDWGAPKVALGGTRGLPDATEIHFVMPLHASRALVSRVDFVSTAASNRAVPPWLFTELGVLHWCSQRQGWRLLERHAGVAVEQIRERTGFPVLVDGDVPESPPIDEEWLQAVERVDPRRVRELDFVTGPQARLERLAQIEAAEHAAVERLVME